MSPIVRTAKASFDRVKFIRCCLQLLIVTAMSQIRSPICLHVWEHGTAEKCGKNSVNPSKVLSTRQLGLTILYDVQRKACCKKEIPMERLLIIDDDVELCGLVTEYLGTE